ncbi:hypothetical protein ACP4OV_007812 [Aristida adscensionis]
MDGVQSIESLAAGDAPQNYFRTLGPTLLISMGYLDLGKWVVALEAGSRFGYDLVLLVLFFNLSAILCQYLSSCIGIVTGKNLAEICRQEYSETICAVLGLQAGLSLLTSEVAMIAGIGVGFNLVFEYNNLVTSICFASVVVNLLPYTLSRLGKRIAGMFNACIAGFTLLCFVLGLLVSHPKTPVDMHVMFPKLSGESAYSVMALLGSNLIAHSFYTHSSVVQVQRRFPALTLGSLFHDHLFSLLFTFSGVFLVNYVLLSSAAVVSKNAMAINFKEAKELMNQIFTNPAAPVLLLVILVFSGHIISLTCIIGSGVISEHFFGVKLPLFAHHMVPKGLAVITTIYNAKIAGLEGLYQLLIICPVIQAMFLPSSVIPVIRVSSSRLLMGRHRTALYVEVLAFLAFLLTLFTNIIFAAEILFGDSTWTNDLKGNSGYPIIVPYTAVVLISCVSIAFTLYLAATPLKSSCNEAERQHSHRETTTSTCHTETRSLENGAHKEVQMSSVDAMPIGSLGGFSKRTGHQKSDFEHTAGSDTTTESGHGTQQLIARKEINPGIHASLSVSREKRKSAMVDWTEQMSEVYTATIVKYRTAENFKMNSSTEKVVVKESAGDRTPLTSHGPPSFASSREEDSGAGSVSDSLSTLYCLDCAERRRLATQTS